MKKRLNLFISFAAIILVLVAMLGGAKLFHSTSESGKEYRYIALFSEVAALVRTDYVHEVKPGDKFPGAYSAMLASLDKLSAYLDVKKTRLYPLYLQGKACDSGLYGTKSAGYFLITGIDSPSPAHTAGLKPGDLIKAVNGKSIYSLSFWEMYLSLFSESPTSLELIVLKKDASNPVKIELQTRMPSANAISIDKKIENNIMLIQLNRFDSSSLETIESALKEEKAKSGDEPLKLILDLRKYRGGDFNTLSELAKLFFSPPMRVEVKSKLQKQTLTLGSSNRFHYKAAIIIDASTILYGEMLAALFKNAAFSRNDKDSDFYVTLVGSKTRGFVSQLRHLFLTDKSSILITEGLYYLAGKNLADTGVAPDVEFDSNQSGDIVKRCVTLLNSPQKPEPSEQPQSHDNETDQEKK